MVKGIGFVILVVKKGKNEKARKPNPAKIPMREMIPATPSGFCQKDCDLNGKIISERSSIQFTKYWYSVQFREKERKLQV